MTTAESDADPEYRRRAVRRGLELFARRRRTRLELESALGRDFSPDAVRHAVERLITLGYVDDGAWAADYVARPRAQQRSAALLRRELTRLGISGHDADEALCAHDDSSAALEAAARRLPALRSLEANRRVRRLRDYLRRRGFSGAVVESTLARVLDAERAAI